MAHRSFRDFLDALEKAGELSASRSGRDRSAITEWADREMKSPGGGKALLFEKPIIDGKPSALPGGDQHHGLATGAWRWRCRSRASTTSRRRCS